jgi:hypothetical protein
MEAEQFISHAATELEMVEAQLRDVEARAVALRARGDGLRFLIQYGREALTGVCTAGTTPSDIGARRAGRATGKTGLPWRATRCPPEISARRQAARNRGARAVLWPRW